MTGLDPRREQYAGAITQHLWGDPAQIDDATTAVMALADSEKQHAETELVALRQMARGYCPHCGRGDATPTDWEQQKQRAEQAEAAIIRVRALHRKATHGDDCVHCAAFGPGYDNTWPCQTIRVLDGTEPRPATPARGCRFTGAGQHPCPPTEPCPTCGPTTAEAADQDRRWWNGEKHGER